MRKWIDEWIASKDESFYRRGTKLLPEKWQKFIDSNILIKILHVISYY